ncbi:MAG: RCC1 domain-containing protein, partial [Gemmatimonadaceae bacterium]
MNTAGGVRCWGRDNAGQSTVPTDLPAIAQVSAGRYHTCAVETVGRAVCWGGIGENAFGQATVPADLPSVTEVIAATSHTCALQADGTVVCWGEDAPQTRVPVGLNSVVQLSTSTDHTCVLKTDRTVVCWGFNLNGQSTVPPGFPPVSQVSVGERYTCVLMADNTMRCWGNNELGQTNVPADIGPVSQISAGTTHACALKTSGTVACWGENGSGQSTVPSTLTSVRQVSAAAGHSCALKTDGTVVCWGFNGSGQIDVPAGLDLIPGLPQTISFTSVPPSPAVVGAAYTVTATGGGSGNPVTFSIPTTSSVCSVSDNTVTFLAVGSCTIAADQAASTEYSAGTQVTQTFNVVGVQAIQFTSVAPNPGVVGATYVLSAHGGASGNDVTFASLTETVCTVGGSIAHLIHAGTCTIAADQADGNGYLAAPQVTQSFTAVDPLPQGITFTSVPPEPALLGGSYTITASGGGSGNPVLFGSLTPSVCFVIGNTVNLVSRGTCHVVADQAGNVFYLPAAEAVQIFDIFDVQAITFTSAPPAPGVVGGTYSISAIGGLSGNSVTFSSLSSSVCTVSGSTVNLNSAGTCVIAADQAEGSGYLAAPRKMQSFSVVEPIPQIISFTSAPPNPGIVGGSYVVTASGGGSGYPVLFSSLTPSVCFVLGNTVTLRARGTCRVAADQTGNTYYLPANEVTQEFDIYDVQAITFTSVAPAPAFVGEPYSVAAVGGLSGNRVTFSSLSSTVCTVSGSTVTPIRAGTCSVAADQAAGGGYLAAPQTVQRSNVVEPQAQRIEFTSSPEPNPGVVGGTYSVSATGGGSGNPVTFSSLSATTCSVSGATVTLAHAGTCTVAADQAGASGYLRAPQATQSFSVVDLQPQTISFTSSPPSVPLVSGSYSVSATGGGSGNAVVFSSLTASVCSVTG